MSPEHKRRRPEAFGDTSRTKKKITQNSEITTETSCHDGFKTFSNSSDVETACLPSARVRVRPVARVPDLPARVPELPARVQTCTRRLRASAKAAQLSRKRVSRACLFNQTGTMVRKSAPGFYAPWCRFGFTHLVRLNPPKKKRVTLILSPSTSNSLSRKSTPTVASTLGGNSPAHSRCVRQVFPTPESPITTTLKVRYRLSKEEKLLPKEPENSREDSI